MRVTLLGEALVAFRDTDGRAGLLAERCPHRGASLFFGRNEGCGLRCVYHGWKFDLDGHCLDMPNEPAESDFRHRVRQTAYPCRERGGAVWAYLGPPDLMPGLPELEWMQVPDDQYLAVKRLQRCNWAQAMEGDLDSSHISMLHNDLAGSADSGPGLYIARDSAPKFELVETEFGMMVGARRNAEDDSHYWRVNQYVMPWHTLIPGVGDHPLGSNAWIPADDHHTWVFTFDWHPTRPLTHEERPTRGIGRGNYAELIPGTFTPIRNADNDYLIDRELQTSGRSFTGIDGVQEQDMAMTEGMGPIMDRTSEHLGAADAAIIQLRRRLIAAARDLQRGTEPPGLDPATHHVRGISIVLPREGTAWPEAIREAMVARPDRLFVSA